MTSALTELPAAESSAGRAAFVLAVVLCLAVAGCGLARNSPSPSRVWALLLGGWLLLGAGDLTAAVEHAVAGSARAPMPADVLRLLGYLLLTAGLLGLAGGRRPAVPPGGTGPDNGALLDATLVGTAAATVAGVFLILPAVDGPATGAHRVVAMACPMVAAVTLAVLTRLFTTHGARTPAFYLLAASVVVEALAAGGSMAAERSAGQSTAGVHPVLTLLLAGLTLAGYLLFALAALHPSVRTVSESAPGRGERLTAARLGALGAAMLLTPATLAAQAATGGPRHLPLVAVGSTCVIVAVLVRIRGLLRRVEIQAAQLARAARSDGLTGLPNRRSWDFELARAATRAREEGRPLAVAMLDIDHFKAFNDSRGHQAGDELLRSAAAAWRKVMGRAGTLARYGGEEFALAIVGATVEDAVALLERMAAVMPYGQTFSAGAAAWDFLEDPADAVARADAAMYAVKRGGRNGVVSAAVDPGDATAAHRPNG